MKLVQLFNPVRLALGLTALGLGVLVYATDRSAGRTYFLPDTLELHSGGNTFGSLGQHLPTLLHVLAFCLLTAAVLRVRWRGALAICIGWLAVDAAFEIGQHEAIAPLLARWTPDWFAGIPLLENTVAYFTNGRFDPLDLVSIAAGAVLALPLILATRRFDPPPGEGV